MIEKVIYKIILSGIIVFSLFSCAQLQKKYVYNNGEVNQNVYTKIISDEKIGVQDSASTIIKGHITSEKDGLPGISIIFQEIETKEKYGTQSDFDGFYSIVIPSGKYHLKTVQYKFVEDIKSGTKKVFDFTYGELRELNLEIYFGPETSVSYSIEFKNERAYEKALKRAKELNLSLLEYVRLEK